MILPFRMLNDTGLPAIIVSITLENKVIQISRRCFPSGVIFFAFFEYNFISQKTYVLLVLVEMGLSSQLLVENLEAPFFSLVVTTFCCTQNTAANMVSQLMLDLFRYKCRGYRFVLLAYVKLPLFRKDNLAKYMIEMFGCRLVDCLLPTRLHFCTIFVIQKIHYTPVNLRSIIFRFICLLLMIKIAFRDIIANQACKNSITM